MKRSVVSFAVLGGFAGLVSAQSSVTLFGVVDVNVRTIKNDERTYQLAQDGMSSSRLGFRGVEDMGGGLKAGFWLEGALGPDTGRGGASFGNGTTSSGGENSFLFQRRSTVSLSNQWGEIRLGRDNTPTYWAWTVYDPFNEKGLGNSQNLATDVNLLSGTGGSYGTLSRANNTVGYILPGGTTGSGLVGQLMVAAGESAPGNKYYGGRIGYSAGPFSVAVAYGETDVTASGNITSKVWNLGASWNFGVAKIMGFYNAHDVSGGSFAGSGQDNWLLGVVAPFGQWNFKASWSEAKGNGTIDGSGATQWAIGADYNLSKRTAIYATWAQIDNEANSRFRVNSNSSALSAGRTSQGADMGIRHTF